MAGGAGLAQPDARPRQSAGRKLPALEAPLHSLLHLHRLEREPEPGDADHQTHGGSRADAGRLRRQRLQPGGVGPAPGGRPRPAAVARYPDRRVHRLGAIEPSAAPRLP